MVIDIVNTVVAVLALIVAIGAVCFSKHQANRSDKISLMGLRIDFYNRLAYISSKYAPLTKIKIMLGAKNAHMVFGGMTGNRTMNIVFSSLSHGQSQMDVSVVFKQIIEDMNYLDINKYLFDNSVMLDEINEIIDKLKQFKITLSANFQGKGTEAELQDALESLGYTFDNNLDKLSEQIKDIIKLGH